MRPFPKKLEMMDDEMAEIISQKTPAERLAIAHSMWRMARNLLRASVTQNNPTWTAEQINREVARRLSHGAV
jgi:hypothetical protein